MFNKGAYLFGLLASMMNHEYSAKPRSSSFDFGFQSKSHSGKSYRKKGFKPKHGATNPGLRRLWRATIGKGYENHTAFAKHSKRYRWSELESFWAKAS